MNPEEAYKNKILERLALKIADYLEQGQLTKEQASEISSYVLDNIDNCKNNSELLNFLEQVASKWPMFSFLASNDDQVVTEDKTQEKVKEIDSLIGENKIEEALKVATDANKTPDTNGAGGVS